MIGCVMLNIKEIEIEGFRGFTKNTPIAFNTPLILIYGGNHQGKSSVLNAIEWCLYGDKCLGEKSGIRERVGKGESAWRVANDNTDRANVKIKIESGKGIFTISRGEVKGKGKKGKSTKVSLPDGALKDGDDAEQEIARLLRVSFRDFATTVYQHQETIRDFVIQTPSERSDAMDRLLGLSDYRNILDGVKNSDVSKIQKELVDEFSKFQTRIDEARKIRQKDIDDKINEASEKGLSDEELNEGKLLKLAESTIEDVSIFAEQLGIAATAISPLSNWKGTGSFVTNIKNECDHLWAGSPDVKEQSEKQKKRSEIVSLKSQYETQYRNFKTKEKELQDFEKENGNKGEIENRIKDVIEKIEAIDKEIKRTSSKAKLVEEGISLLEMAAPSKADICPLCGKSELNLLEHLQKEWREKIEAQVRDLKNQKEKLDKKKTDLERLGKEHSRLSHDNKEEKNRLSEIIGNISKFLHKELSGKDDPTAMLSKEIKNIDLRLKEIEDAIRSKREKIDAIFVKTETMNLLYEILLLKDKLEEINKIQKTDEYKRQEKIRDDVSNLVGEIEKLSKIIKQCMKEEAEEKIASARSAIDTYFRKITQNPGFRMLNIRVNEDKRTGVNIYTFEDQDGKDPIPILSQGDLNSIALSIFLGLAKTIRDSHPLGFTLMDDPSQSLDLQQKARLVEVINELCEMKSVIVSTMDDEFKQLLRDNITKAKTMFMFSDWMPDSGPKISEEI